MTYFLLIMFAIVLIFLSAICVEGEVFTAISDLENLLYTEAELIRTIDSYILLEEQKLTRMKRILAEYETIHETAEGNKEKFLSNPVNAYLLVKRLTRDWRDVENVMIENVGKDMIDNITHNANKLYFPDEEDLSGAAAALMRLQDTYKLDTGSIARGVMGEEQSFKELSASDCFELGRQSYVTQDHYHTVLWMKEALKRYDQEKTKTIAREEILEYLAFSTYQEGDIAEALQLTNELLTILPNHQRAVGNKAYYESALKNADRKKRGDDGQVDHLPSKSRQETYLPERETYERLCRGEQLMTDKLRSKLKCRYYYGHHPFMMVAPVKQEDAFNDPHISIFHDVILDSEVEVVKELAQPRLQRATVQNYKTGELETATYRISKSAWLKTEEHPLIARLIRRIFQVTGLEVETAEELQVANYGIGGHYEPHYDFARSEERNAFKSLGTGNRIATWLNYMSDVDAGGATVFPNLNLALWPKKGAAAFWYNLFKNGEGDLRTRHAACPVLAGWKWVSNKWFHERGQEFFRRCTLNQEE